MSNPKNAKVNIIPSLRYADAAKAIDWLCDAFGFERQMVVPGENGAIAHAQLGFGNGMLMLGSGRVCRCARSAFRWPSRVRNRPLCDAQ